jgi:hypothetical protein
VEDLATEACSIERKLVIIERAWLRGLSVGATNLHSNIVSNVAAR